MFEEFWKTYKDCVSVALAVNANSQNPEDFKELIASAWNDAQALTLSQIVFLIHAKKKKLLKEHLEGQQTTAAVINALGKLAVEISEMKT